MTVILWWWWFCYELILVSKALVLHFLWVEILKFCELMGWCDTCLCVNWWSCAILQSSENVCVNFLGSLCFKTTKFWEHQEIRFSKLWPFWAIMVYEYCQCQDCCQRGRVFAQLMNINKTLILEEWGNVLLVRNPCVLSRKRRSMPHSGNRTRMSWLCQWY